MGRVSCCAAHRVMVLARACVLARFRLAVLLIGLRGGPALSKSVSLYSFFGYCLLVIAAILAARVLVQVFRLTPDERRPNPIFVGCTRAVHMVFGISMKPTFSGCIVTIRGGSGLRGRRQCR